MQSKPPPPPKPRPPAKSNASMPSEVRTVIGVPIMQEPGKSQRPPAPRPTGKSVPPPPAEILDTPQFPWGQKAPVPPPEELSSSALVDDDASVGVPVGSPLGSPFGSPFEAPSPTMESEEPRFPGPSDDADLRVGPEPAPFPWLQPLFDRFPALERLQRGKPKFFLPVLASLTAFCVLILFVAAVKGLTKKKSPDPSSTRSGTARTESAAARPSVTAATPPGATAAVSAPCTVSGEPKVLAPQILLPSGVEAVSTPKGIALGFATAEKSAAVVVVDPQTLKVLAKANDAARDVVRRVVSSPQGKPIIDIDRTGDALGGRRTAVGQGLDLGGAGGHLAWARHGTDKTTPLWPLDGDAPVEALRAIPLEGEHKGYVVTFRRSGSIWLGMLDENLATVGELTSMPGLGAQIGSPAIATSGDIVTVVWADRAASSDPYRLRWLRWKIGGPHEAAQDFTPPDGGLGAPFMSPGIAGLGKGRFLLTWTEGPFSGHQVRAATLDANGKPEGAPLSISKEGANAGQGQAAFAADGTGVVAYLVASAKPGNFELAATPVRCPSP